MTQSVFSVNPNVQLSWTKWELYIFFTLTAQRSCLLARTRPSHVTWVVRVPRGLCAPRFRAQAPAPSRSFRTHLQRGLVASSIQTFPSSPFLSPSPLLLPRTKQTSPSRNESENENPPNESESPAITRSAGTPKRRSAKEGRRQQDQPWGLTTTRSWASTRAPPTTTSRRPTAS